LVGVVGHGAAILGDNMWQVISSPHSHRILRA
jgi:hypothetical protein